MRRKILSSILAVAVVLIAMLNVSVVSNSKSESFVKMATLTNASADEFSSSISSSSDPFYSGTSSGTTYGEFEDDPLNTAGFYDEYGYVPPGKKRKKMTDLFYGTRQSSGMTHTLNGVSDMIKGTGIWKLSIGGKLAEATSSNSSPLNTTTTSGEITAGATFEFGSQTVVNYNMTYCDKTTAAVCYEFNTFVSKTSM